MDNIKAPDENGVVTKLLKDAKKFYKKIISAIHRVYTKKKSASKFMSRNYDSIEQEWG